MLRILQIRGATSSRKHQLGFGRAIATAITIIASGCANGPVDDDSTAGSIPDEAEIQKKYTNLQKAAESYVQQERERCAEQKSLLSEDVDVGVAGAQYRMGNWYASACGGYDKLQAYEWYHRAAAQGYTEANYISEEHKRITQQEEQRERDLSKRERAQKEQELEQRRIEAQEYAQKAVTQFRSIHLSIVESDTSKRVRSEIRDKLKTIPEPKEPPQIKDASGLFDLILVPIGLGPYLPLGILVGDGSGPLPSEEEWAEIKNNSTQLSSLLVDEDVDWNLQTQLLDLANKQQAFGLLKTSLSDTPRAFHQLHIEVEEIGFFKLPGDYRRARFWLAATAMLAEGNQKSTHKRFCYATQRAMPLSSWTGKERFMQELNAAYRNVSNQILMDLIGLAPDPDANQPWNKTALACLTDNNKPRTF